jgi:hypothetical protein
MFLMVKKSDEVKKNPEPGTKKGNKGQGKKVAEVPTPKKKAPKKK